ncbi:hypothetical protein ACWC2T_16045 [Streptomyces sp. NPDC001393]
MLVALFAIAAEVAVLILYTVRRGSGAAFPSLGDIDLRNLVLAAMALAAGYALTQNEGIGAGDLVALILLGGILPTQAGAAVRRLVPRWPSADWLIACAGGLAAGSLP